MLNKYTDYFAHNKKLYEERINKLIIDTKIEYLRYIMNEAPLFVVKDGERDELYCVTMDTIENDLAKACAEGIHFVEYKTQKHLYIGYKGDNISFLTGKYYISDDGKHIEIPGAPSYTKALMAKIPGVIVTFREESHNMGILRVELS